jgi:hypothetical protein
MLIFHPLQGVTVEQDGHVTFKFLPVAVGKWRDIFMNIEAVAVNAPEAPRVIVEHHSRLFHGVTLNLPLER